MKVKYKEQVGEFTVVRFLTDATVDIEASKREEKTVWAKVGPEADLIEDSDAEQIQQALDGKGEHQQLLDTGEYIDDYRGVEYNIKRSGRWEKEKIEELGESLPAGAVLQEDLTREQQAEMSAQRESDRIAALTPEKRAEELSNKIHALAREANNKAADAELLGEDFDKLAWLQPKREELERLYAA